MNLNLHIERLVLDGLSVANHEAALVQTAVEAELGRLLGNERSAPVESSAYAGIGGGEIHLRPGVSARELGLEIGRSLFGSLAQSAFEPREQPTRRARLPQIAEADQKAISPNRFVAVNQQNVHKRVSSGNSPCRTTTFQTTTSRTSSGPSERLKMFR